MSFQSTILFILVLSGALYDWKSRRIPNWLTFGILFFFLLFNGLYLRSLHGAINCLLGFFAGVGLLLIPYLFGGMGAGDVKLLGAVGSIVGCKNVLIIFLYSTFCGLVISIIWLLLTPSHLKFLITTGQALPAIDKKQKIPYGIAIALGTFLYMIFGLAWFG